MAAAAENPLQSAAFGFGIELIEGEVERELPAGTYTYYRLRAADDSSYWVVTLGAKGRGASFLRVKSFGSQGNFVSQRLGRRFERLHFAKVIRRRDGNE